MEAYLTGREDDLFDHILVILKEDQMSLANYLSERPRAAAARLLLRACCSHAVARPCYCAPAPAAAHARGDRPRMGDLLRLCSLSLRLLTKTFAT